MQQAGPAVPALSCHPNIEDSSLADRATAPQLRSWLVMAATVVIAGAGFLLHAHALINRDEAWLLIAARRMLGGGSYLKDFFEVNMPLAIAVYIPAGLLADALHHSQQFGITLYVTALAVQSAYLAAQALAAGPEPVVPRASMLPIVAWMLFGLMVLPGLDFGQKEHLIALLGLPLACSLANADALSEAPAGLRAYRALLAAIGFYLKPHYALLPFLLLGAVAWQRRSWFLMRSPELLTLLLAGAANAIWVLWKYPDWFTCAQWARDLYTHFGARHWQDLLRVDGFATMALCLLTQGVAFTLDRPRRRILAPLLLASGYAAIVYLVQYKAWAYQLLVAQLLVVAAQGILVALYWPRLPASASRLALALLVGGGTALLVSDSLRAIRRQPTFAAVVPIARGLASAHPGDSVYAFSTEVAPVFPAVPVLGLRWVSRYSSLWPLLELARVENGIDPADRVRLEQAYRQPLVDSVVEDFQHYQPDHVLVDRRNLDVLPADFDILALFLADPRFAAIWRGYHRVGIVSLKPDTYDYDVYSRSATGDSP